MSHHFSVKIFDLSHYTLSGYAFLPLFVAAISVLLGIFVLLHENFSRTSLVFSIMLFFNGPVWFGSNAMMTCAHDPQIAMFWFKVHHLGYVPIATVLLLFTLMITKKFSKYKAVFWTYAGLNLLVLYLAFFTNLLIVGTHKFKWGYYPAYGKLGIVHIVIYSAMLCFVVFIFVRAFLEAAIEREKRRIKLFIIAVVIGSQASMNFFGYFNIPLYPFGCIFIFIFFVLFARAMFQYNLINIEPEMVAHKIIRTISEILLITDLNGFICIINPSAEKFLGLPERQIIGRHLSVFFNETFAQGSDKDSFIQKAEELKGREIWYHPENNDESQALNLSASVLKDRSGKPSGIVFTGKDRTAYKRLQEDIKNAYQMTQAILEKIPVGVIILSIDKRIRMMNSPALKMLGIDPHEELTGELPAGVSAFLDQEQDRLFMNGESDGLEELTYEMTLPGKERKDIHVLKSIIKIKINDEDVFLIAFVDISRRKRLEDEILRYKEYLEEQVHERTGELQSANNELLKEVRLCESIGRNLKEKLDTLERFKDETISREKEMIEIKRDINDLSIQLDRRPPYRLRFLE